MLISVNGENVPQALKERRSWIVWKLENRDGKPTKLPYNAFSGQLAASNDPTTWCAFKSAEFAYRTTGRWSGIGFVFSAEDEFCGIDLDGCRDPQTQVWADWARDIMKEFNTYTELSPSGTGAKMFVRAKAPMESGKNIKLKDVAGVGGKEAGIEVYDKLRYFAVTGKKIAGFPKEPMERQEILNRYCADWFRPQLSPGMPSHTDFYGQPAIIERARKYVARMPIAVSGQNGHNKAFHVACTLVLGFGLSDQEAFPIMTEWSQACQPPWSEREIQHKLAQADKVPGDRNWLRNVQPMQWGRVKVPNYEMPPEPPPSMTLHKSSLDYLDSLNAGNRNLLSLGLADVDYAIGGGVQRGEIVVIAARPSNGKSMCGLQAGYSLAETDPGLIISEEMGRLLLGERAVSYSTGVPKESWTHRQEQVLSDVNSHFSDKHPIHVVECCGTAQRAEAAIARHVEEHKIRWVVVDYGQLLLGKGHNETEQVSQTSKMLRRVASENNLILIVLAQMNRDVESREKWIPKMRDLRNSGQWEQDADVILFLLWPHQLDNKHDPHEYFVFVAKSRNRPINQGTVKCRFEPSRQRVLPEPTTTMDDATTSYDFAWDDDPAGHQLGD